MGFVPKAAGSPQSLACRRGPHTPILGSVPVAFTLAQCALWEGAASIRPSEFCLNPVG